MKSFSKKEALMVGWQTFKERPFFLIGLFVITASISVLTGWAADQVAIGGASIALNVIDFAIQIILGMGMTLILLRVYDKAHTNYADLLEPIHLFWKYLVMTLLVVIITSVGLVLFIVPGVVAALALVFAPYLVVDRNLNTLDAIKESMHITHGHRWNILFFGILVFLINLLGAAAFGLGLFITVPVTALAAVHVYRWLLHPLDGDGVEVTTTAKVLASLGMVTILLVAIAVLYSLGTTTSLSQNSTEQTGNTVATRDAQRHADLANIQLAISLYEDVEGALPASLDEMVPMYFSALPADPRTGASYQYLPSTDRANFDVCASMEGAQQTANFEGLLCKQRLELGGQ